MYFLIAFEQQRSFTAEENKLHMSAFELLVFFHEICWRQPKKKKKIQITRVLKWARDAVLLFVSVCVLMSDISASLFLSPPLRFLTQRMLEPKRPYGLFVPALTYDR